MVAALLTDAPMAADATEPRFSWSEVRVDKAENRNALTFSALAHSSALLQLLQPASHCYQERDLRWLHLLQGIASVPSRKADAIARLAAQALQLMHSSQHKARLVEMLGDALPTLAQGRLTLPISSRALLALRIKDRVAAFLRQWIDDPTEGFVLRREHVVAGMYLDDVVATPLGAGYLRGYRDVDHCCIVVYPWGHGYIQLSNVTKLNEAIETQRRKRKLNEFLSLEHQQLFEQVEPLQEDYSVESKDDGEMITVLGGVDVNEYEQSLKLLEAEHFDANILKHDLAFVERVKSLAAHVKRQRAHSVSSCKAGADD